MLMHALLLFPVFGLAQHTPVGAPSAGMGHASVCNQDIWSSFNNPSGLAWDKGVRAGMFYENRYLLAEMHAGGLAVSVPVNKVGVFGLNAFRFGYAEYNENRFGVCYARKFGQVFSLGVQVNLHWIHFGDIYGDKVTATGEISFQVKPLPRWIIAAHVFNPTRSPIAPGQRERLNTQFRLGTAYQFHEQVKASMEVEASIDLLPTFRAGVEYHPIPLLYLRAGVNTYPISPAFGFGLAFKKFNLDMAAQWLPVLGFSPQASLSYHFGK